MSLFVCSKCNCVENSNLVTTNLNKDKSFPNMFKTEMMGNSSRDTFINDVLYKNKEDVFMLCSECNTGTWHNEFEKVEATEDEIKLSYFSKYNMITPFDHDDNIVKDRKAPHGYRTLTQEDINDKIASKKSAAKTINKLNAFLAIGGLSINDFIKPKSKPINAKSEATSNKFIFKAEIKRKIKELNKRIQIESDIHKLTEMKHDLLEMKNIYKNA